MVVGVLLLLVTTSDLMGMPPNPRSGFRIQRRRCSRWISAPRPLPSVPPAAPAPKAVSDSDVALAPASSNSETSFGMASNPSEGTTSGNGASEEMLEDAETANTSLSAGTSAALAAVTRAVPTPGAGQARSPERRQAMPTRRHRLSPSHPGCAWRSSPSPSRWPGSSSPSSVCVGCAACGEPKASPEESEQLVTTG